NNCTIEKNGYAEKLISFYSHTGTHIDAPGHIVAGTPTLDEFNVNKFIGKGYVIDVSKLNKSIIDKEDLEKYQFNIEESDFVLICSNWSKYWGSPEYFENFPVLSEEAAKWLSEFPLKGVGFDMISPEPVGTEDLLNHKILFASNFIIIENLTNLDKLLGRDLIFCCMPLKLKDSDGSPVRAFAIVD
ncbi:MAG: hypothetical protein QG635_33, partial [Bacteroidota bacterium]|nr:hypothetical protein [Bacteroidota bacterium]